MQRKPTEFFLSIFKAISTGSDSRPLSVCKKCAAGLTTPTMAHRLVCRERGAPSPHPQTLNQRVICNAFESPLSGDALKGVIAKIEQEVTRRIGSTTRNLPIYWIHQVRVRTFDLIELAPLRRQLAVATLPAIPTFVIGRPWAIPGAIHETKYSFIVLNPKNLTKVDLWTSLLLRRFSAPLWRSVINFG
jgi:hypothetical protein